MTFHSPRETIFSPNTLQVDFRNTSNSPRTLLRTHSSAVSQTRDDRINEHAKFSEKPPPDGSSGEILGGNISRSTIYGPKPRYPLISRRLREQGTVLIKICVGPQGLVERLDILRSSGFHGLDSSASSALAQWRFSAVSAPQIGGSLDCYRMPVQFSLEG